MQAGSLSYVAESDTGHMTLMHARLQRLHVLHKCDIPGCVNPDHLFVGNNQDNSHDKAVKGRAARKLTAEQVREIREDSRPGVVLAAVYGVAPCTINDITKRRTWRHV